MKDVFENDMGNYENEDNSGNLNKIINFITNLHIDANKDQDDEYYFMVDELVPKYVEELVNYLQFIYLHHYEEVLRINTEVDDIGEKSLLFRYQIFVITEWVKGLNIIINEWPLKSSYKIVNQLRKMFSLLIQTTLHCMDFTKDLRLEAFKGYIGIPDASMIEEIEFLETHLFKKPTDFLVKESWQVDTWFYTKKGADEYKKFIKSWVKKNKYELEDEMERHIYDRPEGAKYCFVSDYILENDKHFNTLSVIETILDDEKEKTYFTISHTYNK